jgi:dTDP-4-amino-4,6-dideoxy-D-galactose acyltransferase
MVTVGEKQGRGDIGLLAVAAGMQGSNVGVSLVRAAREWARRKGYRLAQVVTQGENVPACRLYEKCGYAIDKVEHFYHFWICP